ncbi:MAG: hypothetical protein ACJAYZ_000480, partial [Bacteroidia bacterium]
QETILYAAVENYIGIIPDKIAEHSFTSKTAPNYYFELQVYC